MNVSGEFTVNAPRDVVFRTLRDPNSFVRFVDGDWYSYFEVSRQTYDAFVTAESHGRFFHDHIRDRYRYRRGP